MLIAVISDTHLPRGKRRIPEACLERLATADLILHAGDFSAAEVLDELE
jgi:predicted phosphodiesterase